MTRVSIHRDFFSEVAVGKVQGFSAVSILGHNPDVDGVEDIWTGGGLYPWMTAATSLEIVSSSTADAAAGTGARQVLIEYLDANYVAGSQTVTLNGTTPVALPTQCFRINNAYMIAAGTGQVNAGDITIRDAGAGTTRAILPVGFGVTRQSQYTVPAGHTLLVVSVNYSIVRQGSGQTATMTGYVGTPVLGIYQLFFESGVGTNNTDLPVRVPFALPEKTDFGQRCTAVSATNTEISAGVRAMLKDNSV